MKTLKRTIAVFALALILLSAKAFGQNALSKMVGGGATEVVKTMPDNALIAAASAKGAPAYHRHLVRPGLGTTYLIRVMNTELIELKVDLSVSNPPSGWTATLDKSSVKLLPGEKVYVKLELKSSPKLPVGSVAAVKVAAKTSTNQSGELTLEAETTAKRKIYYISIDSFGPEYLALNAKGTGLGKDGDWLTPNLHALMKDCTYFPDHKVHLVAATDMNHAAYLSGSLPGTLGLYSVNVFLFGFDEKGLPIIKATPLDLMYYGKDGKPVTNIFNVVQTPALGGNPNAFTAYISGKAWVPEHYLNPVFGLDRIATANTWPDYVTPSSHVAPKNEMLRQILKTRFGRITLSDAFMWEDPYSAEQAMEVIANEDPDVAYILLGAVDAAGHMYGAAWDLDEWKTNNTPDDPSDDVSKVNRRANRASQIAIVKNADAQVGRLIAFLQARGAYDDSYLVVESDHNMETNFFAGPKLDKILAPTGYSAKKDYFLFTVSQIGALFVRPGNNDPKMIPALEKALEDSRVINPMTGKSESPMIVIDREEMKTGIDKVSGERVTLPMELYSEYYIEHPQQGGLDYPDLLILTKNNYQCRLMGVGLASIGMGKMNIPLPKVNVFVGGHGGPTTQHALLMMRGPAIDQGRISGEQSWSSDVAPTLYALEGYQAPESVQGKKLMGK